MKFRDLFQSNQLFALIAKAIEATKVIGLNVIVGRIYGPETLGVYGY